MGTSRVLSGCCPLEPNPNLPPRSPEAAPLGALGRSRPKGCPNLFSGGPERQPTWTLAWPSRSKFHRRCIHCPSAQPPLPAHLLILKDSAGDLSSDLSVGDFPKGGVSARPGILRWADVIGHHGTASPPPPSTAYPWPADTGLLGEPLEAEGSSPAWGQLSFSPPIVHPEQTEQSRSGYAGCFPCSV